MPERPLSGSATTNSPGEAHASRIIRASAPAARPRSCRAPACKWRKTIASREFVPHEPERHAGTGQAGERLLPQPPEVEDPMGTRYAPRSAIRGIRRAPAEVPALRRRVDGRGWPLRPRRARRPAGAMARGRHGVDPRRRTVDYPGFFLDPGEPWLLRPFTFVRRRGARARKGTNGTTASGSVN
jgi:hypothetical protein